MDTKENDEFLTARLVLNEQYFGVAQNLLTLARKRIFVVTYLLQVSKDPEVRPVMNLIGALSTARDRGVDIRILVNIVQPRKGVSRMNEFSTRYLKTSKIECRYLPDNRICHGKVIVVDRHFCLIGSHNWSGKALTTNLDVSVLVRSEKICQEMLQHLDRLWTTAKTL